VTCNFTALCNRRGCCCQLSVSCLLPHDVDLYCFVFRVFPVFRCFTLPSCGLHLVALFWVEPVFVWLARRAFAVLCTYYWPSVAGIAYAHISTLVTTVGTLWHLINCFESVKIITIEWTASSSSTWYFSFCTYAFKYFCYSFVWHKHLHVLLSTISTMPYYSVSLKKLTLLIIFGRLYS